MTLLLARQPGERAFRRRGLSKPQEGQMDGQRSRLAGPPVLGGGHPLGRQGHQGRQRPQVGWRAATAVALAGVSTGGGAVPAALGSLVGTVGAAGGRWKW